MDSLAVKAGQGDARRDIGCAARQLELPTPNSQFPTLNPGPKLSAPPSSNPASPKSMLSLTPALDLIVAALVGLAVGSEREWSGHTRGPDARFAGLRTFGMLGALGGFAGWFYHDGSTWAGVALLAAALLFPVVAYAAAMRRPESSADGTTEVAAMLVAAIGFASGLGYRTAASAAAALIVVLLAEKSALHRWLGRLESMEMRAAVQFAVLSLVVLPLIPEGAFGPYDAIRPRALWMVVLLFSALNFAGYVLRRVVGESRGLAMTGLLGGLVSSTAVTLNFSRRSREHPELASPLSLGVIAACTMLLPRIVVVTAVLRPAVSIAVLPILAAPFMLGAALVARALWATRQKPASDAAAPETSGTSASATSSPSGTNSELAEPSPAPPSPLARFENPLGLASSLQMALAFQAVLIVIAFMQQRIGNSGVLASATLLGLTDMDALTVSMTRLGADVSLTQIAAQAIGIGVLSNTLLKLTIALVIGTPVFRIRVALMLGTMAVASSAGLWFAWT